MRILIVDDDSLNRFLLVHMLEQNGYPDCYEAESGHEALSLAKRIQPELVLLDVMMEDMSGFEVAPLLKAQTDEIYLPIIFITALDDEDSLVRCLDVGGDDFVAKPFNKTILAAKISAHARTRELSKKSYEQNQQLIFYRNAVEREHKIVEHIFGNAVTNDNKLLPYLDFKLLPATDFNGDLLLFSAGPNGGLYYLVGDFTGHGLAAAIGALPVSQAFHAMASKGLSVFEMAATLNETLLKLLPGDMFFAAALVHVSLCGTRLEIWNSGMPDLLLFNAEGDVIERFSSQHMALGILDADEMGKEIQRYQSTVGDRLLAFSDGVIEIMDPEQNMLSEKQIEHWVAAQADVTVTELFERITQFSQNISPSDDLTCVSYTCQSLLALEHQQTIAPIPFHLTFDLDASAIKEGDPVQSVVNMVCSQTGMYALHARLFTVVSELYNNALDHGVLKLDSALKHSPDGFEAYFDLRTQRLAQLSQAEISMTLSFDPVKRSLIILVRDSGPGFDYQLRLKQASLEDCFGRGIQLVAELTDSVQYLDTGNAVEVMFNV
ncbi:fused response regulator/phosphatase [Paraglaciecola agarilytica]|uniref:ATP-binding SpoIIE family protein phosphatase n=1 Tax=Paraglaciecola chathamensis TaxID=368405 RepID=UPI001C0A2790|nr:fused response regulator/phosphatase [Paraglaciecola agarilytica]MBU3016381.1 fused response regulator/phosphatase [Paraglaciecola agarilytica]